MPSALLASGGILWRWASSSSPVQVLLVHRPRYDDWTFPKGKLQQGEALLEAAIREVREETGFPVVVGRRLNPVCYQTAHGPKEVTYWTMQALRGDFVPNDEVDRARWISLPRARNVVSYDHDRRLVEELIDQPPSAVRVVLVRHADAGRRRDFKGPDSDRPLVERGQRQAKALLSLLGAFAPSRVVSAPALRCVQTVEHLARATGVPVETDAAFGEEGFAEDPQPAGARVLAGLASMSDVTVIASQGGVIPALIGRLISPESLGPRPPVAAKSGAWALSMGAGGIAADYYPPTRC